MKKLVLAMFVFVSCFATKAYSDGHGIKMGIILGFTGPIESLTPAMAASAELAFKEASDSGSLLGGKKISVERADSTCVDSAAATAAAEGLISGGVVAIMGADCSGVTGAIATNVAVPNGVVMISPSATSPGLTDLKDLDVKYTNTIMSFTGFVILILLSSMFEGNTFQTIKNISLESWLTVLYAGAIISLLGHLMMFYLYKFYPLDMVLPFYALFPVFGLILTFFIFGEIPSFITILGGIIVITSVFFAQKMR